MRSKWVAGGILTVVFSAGAAAGAVAQQQASQTRREPQFENEHVRVWKSIIMPNQPLTLHRHEHGRTIVALKGGTLDVVDAKGQTQDEDDVGVGQGVLARRRSGRRAARRPEQGQGADRGHRRRDAEVRIAAADLFAFAPGCGGRVGAAPRPGGQPAVCGRGRRST